MKKVIVLFALVSLCVFGLTACNNTQKAQTAKSNALTQLSAEDISLLLKGESPQMLQQAAANPQYVESVLKSLREILAIAAQARKDGIANEPEIKKELDFMTAQVLAYEFEREQNKANPTAAPFASVTTEEVDAFYKEPNKEAEYNAFLETVKKRYAESSPQAAAQPLGEEQLKQVRDGWAKTLLTERKARAAGYDKKREIELQIAVQQASYLAAEYNKRKNKDFEVSDAALNEYIAARPEFDTSKKRAAAEEVLKRVKAGEDFAKLANELSEDPGNKDPKTGKGTKGGLYENVKKGQFVPAFETAALSLEKGQVTENLVETDFGYHVIKLENKKTEKGKDGKEEETYSVRHILISTMTAPDPTNPMARPMNMRDKARDNIRKEMRDKWLEGLVAQNQINLPKAEEIKIEVPPMTQQVPAAPPVSAPAPSPEQKSDAPAKDSAKEKK